MLLILDSLSSHFRQQSVSSLLWLAFFTLSSCLVARVSYLYDTKACNWLAYRPQLILIWIYRITFHPLAKCPRPWLAKVSDFYGAYHNVIGRLHTETEVSRRRYGTFTSEKFPACNDLTSKPRAHCTTGPEQARFQFSHGITR